MYSLGYFFLWGCTVICSMGCKRQRQRTLDTKCDAIRKRASTVTLHNYYYLGLFSQRHLSWEPSSLENQLPSHGNASPPPALSRQSPCQVPVHKHETPAPWLCSLTQLAQLFAITSSGEPLKIGFCGTYQEINC